MSPMRNEKIDGRTVEQIRKQIQELSDSYTPEWEFTTENPDAGSVIGLIFANQMYSSICGMNEVLRQYQTEFVNMLGISLKPSCPSAGVVAMQLIKDTVDGIQVPGGTKLLCSEREENLVFETIGDLYVANSTLTDLIGISSHFGKIISYKGGAKPVSFLPGISEETADTAQLRLFDYSDAGIQQNGILLYHRTMFDTAGESLYLRFSGETAAAELTSILGGSGQYGFYHYSEGGLVPISDVSVRENRIVLRFLEESKKITYDKEEYGLLYIKAQNPVTASVLLQSVEISAGGRNRVPEYMGTGEREADGDRLYPFGEQISLYQEFYIGNDHILSKGQASVCLEFDLSFVEREFDDTREEDGFDLKPIRRKPKNLIRQQRFLTVADEVSLEYFNGIGWRRLPCAGEWKGLFNGSVSGHVEIRFLCPEDWEPVVTGGYEGRVLRFQIIRAANCYMVPCIHKIPVADHVKLSYSFDGRWFGPDRIQIIHGAELEDVTDKLRRKELFPGFSALPYEGEALYLGFDHKFLNGPVSLLFQLKESTYFTGTNIRYEYSSLKGFKQMKVFDHTDNMVNSGIVLFMPPADFAQVEVAGQKRYWIRLVDMDHAYVEEGLYHPIIQGIILNVAEVQNIETKAEEEFYIDMATPNMSFDLGASHILDVSVYVNEKGRFTQSLMSGLIQEIPERLRVEYDFLGGIQEFFVLWEEVPDFRRSGPSDRHYCLDRMTGRLWFGDGTRGMIPTERSGAAFKAAVRRCHGALGNVKPWAIDNSISNLMFVENIGNPIPTYGGSNMESLESALKRGANIISSRNRLVSSRDFVREVMAGSDAIDKAACITGRDIEGKLWENRINLVLLMKDYRRGGYTFNHLKEQMKEQLLSRCEMICRPEDMVVTEPVYVEISVDVWIEIPGAEKAFETQNLIRESIEAFIEPVSSRDHPGWEIGTLPRENQIKILLYSIRHGGYLKNFIVTASYIDKNGRHDCCLDQFRDHPFVIGINGNHHIYLLLPDEGKRR